MVASYLEYGCFPKAPGTPLVPILVLDAMWRVIGDRLGTMEWCDPAVEATGVPESNALMCVRMVLILRTTGMGHLLLNKVY